MPSTGSTPNWSKGLTTRTIRWGILGAGRAARDFSVGLQALPDATLAGVASRTAATVQDFARFVPVQRIYGSYEELVRDPAIDVVYVATPHHRHVADCSLALEHAKPVLCEKPFAVSVREAQIVVDLARKKQLFCMEGMWMRFFPLIHKAQELTQSGAIGDPRMIMADFGVATAYDPRTRFYDPAQGGGALLDRGVYAISLAIMLFGAPEAISGQAGMSPSGVDEHSAVVLRFPKGRLAVLSASLSTHTSNEATVMGTYGKLRLHAPFYCPQKLSISRYSPGVSSSAGDTPSLKQRLAARAKQSAIIRRAYLTLRPLIHRQTTSITQPVVGNGYNYEAAEVMRCLRAGERESPIMPLDESLRIMKIMDEIRAQWGLKYPGE
jgi:predicted dehydrogenase